MSFGGGSSYTPPPAPTVAPAATPAPTIDPQPTPAEKEAEKVAVEKEAKTLRNQKGRSSTILTGAGGLLDEPVVGKKTLLGE